MSTDELPPHCPLCDGPTELRDVTPCIECGGDARELDHARSGIHSFEEVMAFGKFPIVLCDFCQIDFGSYPHHFFGMPISMHTGYDSLKPIRPVPFLKNESDYYCNACGYRLAFLNFVKAARDYFGKVSE